MDQTCSPKGLHLLLLVSSEFIVDLVIIIRWIVFWFNLDNMFAGFYLYYLFFFFVLFFYLWGSKIVLENYNNLHILLNQLNYILDFLYLYYLSICFVFFFSTKNTFSEKLIFETYFWKVVTMQYIDTPKIDFCYTLKHSRNFFCNIIVFLINNSWHKWYWLLSLN